MTDRALILPEDQYPFELCKRLVTEAIKGSKFTVKEDDSAKQHPVWDTQEMGLICYLKH